MKINAVRLRTVDGRYLQANNGGGGYLCAVAVTEPSFWETFFLDPPTSWPLLSGSEIALCLVDGNWGPSSNLVRVEHDVRVLPHGQKDPVIVTYQIGGPGDSVDVRGPFPAGYPGYPGDDPNERIFTITKLVAGNAAPDGTAIGNGDHVTFSFNTLNPDEPVRYWRLRDDLALPHVDGDGLLTGPAPTVFVVEFNEVRSGLGWRPSEVICQTGAQVTAHVTRRADGTGVAGASVLALPPSEPFAGITPASGQVTLSALVQGANRTIVPAGPIQLQTTCDRYRTSTVNATVPDQGSITVQIPLDCTIVSGKVIDTSNHAVGGVWVFLRDQNGMPLRDLNGNTYQVKTDANGTFSFACVPHGYVTATTAADPTAAQSKTIDEGGWTNVTLIVQTTTATLVVKVTDSMTGQPVDGALVTCLTWSGTTSGGQPVTFTNVRPPGQAWVQASQPSYIPNGAYVQIPASGTQTVEIKLDPDPSVQLATAFLLRLEWATQGAAVPKDLDLHLSGPDNAGGRFHCYYNNKKPVSFVALDHDVTQWAGPETIGVSQVGGAFVAGDYHCWVHDYSGTPSFAQSGATVTLLSVDPTGLPNQRARYEVSAVSGTPESIWFVLKFSIDQQGTLVVTPVMSFQAGSQTTVL